MPRHPPCALNSLTLRQAHSAIQHFPQKGTLGCRSIQCARSAYALRFTQYRKYVVVNVLRTPSARLHAACTPSRLRDHGLVMVTNPGRRPAARLQYPTERGSPPVLYGLSLEWSPSGGAGGTRTPDFRLAKAALSQLSYGPASRETPTTAWWAILDSNQGPQSYQDCALTG